MPLEVGEIIARADQMAADRSVADSHWEEIRNFMRPRGSSFTSREPVGGKRRSQVLDNTAEEAGELLAATLNGMLTSQAIQWFKVKASRASLNRNRNVAIWLGDTTRRVGKLFKMPRTNWSSQAHKAYLSLCFLGTAGMFVRERPGNVPLFQTRPLRELFIQENEEGFVDTVYRRFNLTARQAAQRWPKKAGGKLLQAAGDTKKQDNEFEFLHAIYPRTDAIPGRIDNLNLPVASTWINLTEKHRIRDGGFHELPLLVPRWETEDEVWGRGPGERALPQTKLLQRSTKVTISGAEQAIKPPLQVADDGVLSDVRMANGALNVVRREFLARGGDAIKRIDTGVRPDLGEDFNDGIRLRIENAFYKSLLSLTRDPRMTATQFLEVLEETLRIFSPFLGNLQSEWLALMIERLVFMLIRQGALLPLPEELDGEDFEVEFISPIAQAQRLAEARGVARTVELMLPLAQFDPTIFDNQDGDETYRHTAELLGQPINLLRSEQDRDAIRQSRAEQQQAEQQRAAIVDLANAAGQAAPAVRELREGAAA